MEKLDTTKHSFSTELAKITGISGAIILNNVYFWIEKNLNNQKNIEDDTVWVNISRNRFLDYHPYFSASSIRTITTQLIKNDFLKTKRASTGNLSYTLTEKGWNYYFRLMDDENKELKIKQTLDKIRKSSLQKTKTSLLINLSEEKLNLAKKLNNNLILKEKIQNRYGTSIEFIDKMFEFYSSETSPNKIISAIEKTIDSYKSAAENPFFVIGRFLSESTKI
ncbi:hypothetical protein [Cetobacterium sp. SF1]|uniref:hypothetical protein n=1 Tax=Cetobacterium sp. SF1 TaxID=3417654 RepID=UPI003CFAF850